jgi:hypothetical protein
MVHAAAVVVPAAQPLFGDLLSDFNSSFDTGFDDFFTPPSSPEKPSDDVDCLFGAESNWEREESDFSDSGLADFLLQTDSLSDRATLSDLFLYPQSLDLHMSDSESDFDVSFGSGSKRPAPSVHAEPPALKKRAIFKSSFKQNLPTRRLKKSPESALSRKATAQQVAAMPCDPEDKRNIHNVLERKRRNELKHCYHELRINVPGICDDDRTPTGHILQQATEYIHQLNAEEAELLAALEVERQRNAELRDELATALSR